MIETAALLLQICVTFALNKKRSDWIVVFLDWTVDLQIIQLICFFIGANGPEETYEYKSAGGWNDGFAFEISLWVGCVCIFITKNIFGSQHIWNR